MGKDTKHDKMLEAAEQQNQLMKELIREIKGLRRDGKKQPPVEDDFVDIRDMGVTS